MIKHISKNILLGAALASIGFAAQAQTAQGEEVYVIDQRGAVVKSGADLCWRTGYWTPAAAAASKFAAECDKDLASKVAAPPPAAAAKPAAAAAPKPSAEKVTVSADALFDFNKATLRPEGKAKLDDVAGKAKAIKLEVIVAVGHADRIGKDAYNQKLSEQRAAAVKEYLVSKGIEANRVYTEGKGEKQPKTTAAQCGTSVVKSKKLIDCLQPDRRVDIEVIGTK